MSKAMVLAFVVGQLAGVVGASAETAAVQNFTSTYLLTNKQRPPVPGKTMSFDTQGSSGTYSGWTIASYDNRTFLLRTETCEYKISAMPAFSSFKTHAEANRWGYMVGFVGGFLKHGLISGQLPKSFEEDIQFDWSNLSIRSTAGSHTPNDYNFAGMLTSPKPISVRFSGSLPQPSCTEDGDRAILIGRSADQPAQTKSIVIYVFDVKGVHGGETDHARLDSYFCRLDKDFFSEQQWHTVGEVGWALAKALLSRM